jgi:hypothetical protein
MYSPGWLRFFRFGLLALAGMLAAAGSLRAQDAFNDDLEVEIADNAGAVMVMQQQPNIEQFEQWVFNRMGGAGIARNRLSAALELHIDEINRVCGINDLQKKKLLLAGRGDIKRFFDRVEEAKRRYVLVANDQNHNIWEDIQPLQSALNAGIFVEDSIFAKTVNKTLNEEQSALLSAQETHRNQNRYAVTIDWFIAHIDKGLGLRATQRKRLAELLKETRPPRRFGSGDYYYLMYRAAQVDEEKVKPIFDDIQWKIFSTQLNQARGMQQWLKNNGLLEDEPQDAARERKLVEAARAKRIIAERLKEEVQKKAKAEQERRPVEAEKE